MKPWFKRGLLLKAYNEFTSIMFPDAFVPILTPARTGNNFLEVNQIVSSVHACKMLAEKTFPTPWMSITSMISSLREDGGAELVIINQSPPHLPIPVLPDCAYFEGIHSQHSRSQLLISSRDFPP